MARVNDVLGFLTELAPVGMKMDFDNVGLLVGRGGADASVILVSLDITGEVISEAIEMGAGLIVSHHPLFFSLKGVTDADVTGGKILRLAENGVAAICMHTNLDAARGGACDALAAAAGIADGGVSAELLTEEGRLSSGEAYSYGRYGYLKNPCSISEYMKTLKLALKTSGLRYYDAGNDVHKVAVVGGSGGTMLKDAVEHGCDTFVTADIKYDVFLEAKELGISLIDADHFCTENVVTGVLAKRLREEFPESAVTVSQRHGQTVRFC